MKVRISHLTAFIAMMGIAFCAANTPTSGTPVPAAPAAVVAPASP